MSIKLCKEYKNAQNSFARYCKNVGKLLSKYEKQVNKLLKSKQSYTAKELDLLLSPIICDTLKYNAEVKKKYEGICELYASLAKIDREKLANPKTPECKFYQALTDQHLETHVMSNAIYAKKFALLDTINFLKGLSKLDSKEM